MLEVTHDFADPGVEGAIGLLNRCFGEILAQLPFKRGSPIAETHRANAARGPRHQYQAEGAGGDGVSNRDAFAAAPIFAWRHAQRVSRSLVEPAAGIESGAVDRVGDGRPRPQFRPHPPGPVRGGILTRRDADDVFEDSMEMMAAQSD